MTPQREELQRQIAELQAAVSEARARQAPLEAERQALVTERQALRDAAAAQEVGKLLSILRVGCHAFFRLMRLCCVLCCSGTCITVRRGCVQLHRYLHTCNHLPCPRARIPNSYAFKTFNASGDLLASMLSTPSTLACLSRSAGRCRAGGAGGPLPAGGAGRTQPADRRVRRPGQG